jgi:hypothetical protein
LERDSLRMVTSITNVISTIKEIVKDVVMVLEY